MKFLFDQNLSRRLVQALSGNCPGSQHVLEAGLSTASDLEVWEFAKVNGFIIVTKDSDFSDLSILRGHPPHIVWIRLGNVNTSAIEFALLSKVQEIEKVIRDSSIGLIEIF